jgi:ABC-2 type transport system permease protein
MNWGVVWAVARNDLAVWRRSPWAVAAAVIPPTGMGLLVASLTLSVGRQPVALVVEGRGPQSQAMAAILEADTEAYLLQVVDAPTAERLILSQQVAAIIRIPADFDARVSTASARVDVFLNNVDIDFADDIRRTAARSVAEFDAPDLGVAGEQRAGRGGIILPNPYHVAIAERDLRSTNVTFAEYQVIPIVLLLVINVGVLGTALLTAHDFERGTAGLLLLAPSSRAAVVAGRGLGSTLATLTLVVPAVAVGAGFGLVRPEPGHWPAVVALLLAATLMSVGIGLVLGTTLRQARLVAMVGLNLVTYLFFLGGGFATIAFLPNWLQVLSRLVPTSYAIAGLRQALFYPDLVGFGLDLAVMSGVAVAALAAGSIAFGGGLKRG